MATLMLQQKRLRQKGFSLIELMVAMVLSLFLLSGLYLSMVSNQRSYETSRSQHLQLTKSRMVQHLMRLYSQQAGYKDFNQIYYNTDLPADGSDWIESQAVSGIDEAEDSDYSGVLSASDVLQVRFYGSEDGDILLCDGSTASEGIVYTLDLYVDNSNQLICKDTDEGGSSTGSIVIGKNIESMEIQYGQGDSNSYAHLTAGSVTDWLEVNQIRIGLLTAQEVSQGTITNTSTYQVLDESVTVSDKRIYKTSLDAILLGNQGD